MTTSQRLIKWASDIHLARAEVERLRAARWDLQCERERSPVIIDGAPVPSGKQERPCWKANLVPAQIGDYGRVESQEYWDHAGGNWEDSDGNHHLLWCSPCQAREKLRKPYAEAKKRLGYLRGSLWRLAKRAHADVEAELDAVQ